MDLNSYACDLCILQKRETMNLIGVSVTTTRPVLQIFRLIKDKLVIPFFMKIIILMTWSIWTIRNNWMFNGIDPSVDLCKRKFKFEFSLLLHRARPALIPAMTDWVQSL
uniref:Reverse transcriptase zinc-binding domain-containing protein n=1 Tax=Setaria viridis TaxID=4556 RepID=A0A4U6USU0_SETVI|nr:hypothetical protein SEVIR_5G455600v2 [Setaria viridis]